MSPPSTRLPTVVVSSVVRSAHQGDSHGGVYLVDLETGEHRQTIDWNDGSINWEGRGADRGLRGIKFHNGEVYIAASDEVFVFTPGFERLRSFRNPFLKHCHETYIEGDRLYLTSTGFDSILEYDIPSRRFVRGYMLRAVPAGPPPAPGLPPRMKMAFGVFNPESGQGPPPGDTTHINSVTVRDGVVFAAGVRMPRIIAIRDGRPEEYAVVPPWTHNARPYGDGTLFNSTERNTVALASRDGTVRAAAPIVMYDESELLNTHLPKDHARQGFARGLCTLDPGPEGGTLVAVGSSPSTVSVYRLEGPGAPGLVKSVNLTMDIRNAVHGLEVWPFA